MDGAVVSWACKKKTVVLLSTMEAKLIKASQEGLEVLKLKELFGDLGMMIFEPMPMWIDNQAANMQLEREKSTSSAKHVDIRFKFICHYTQTKVVQPSFVQSRNVIADLLKKALPAPRTVDLRGMLNLVAVQDDVEEEC